MVYGLRPVTCRALPAGSIHAPILLPPTSIPLCNTNFRVDARRDNAFSSRTSPERYWHVLYISNRAFQHSIEFSECGSVHRCSWLEGTISGAHKQTTGPQSSVLLWFVGVGVRHLSRLRISYQEYQHISFTFRTVIHCGKKS